MMPSCYTQLSVDGSMESIGYKDVKCDLCTVWCKLKANCVFFHVNIVQYLPPVDGLKPDAKLSNVDLGFPTRMVYLDYLLL